MHRFPGKMFLLSRGKDHFSNKKFLLPTPQYINFKNGDIFTQFNKNDSIRQLWRFFSQIHIHRLSQNMFLLILRQDHISNKKFFVATFPFIDFKNSDIFTQFNKNYRRRDLQLLVSETCMHRFPENMFLLTLRQDHFSNKKIFSFYSPIHRLQKQ